MAVGAFIDLSGAAGQAFVAAAARLPLLALYYTVDYDTVLRDGATVPRIIAASDVDRHRRGAG